MRERDLTEIERKKMRERDLTEIERKKKEIDLAVGEIKG